MRWQKLQKIIFALFIFLVIMSISAFYFLADEFSVFYIRSFVGEFGIWAPAVFILIYIIGTIFIPSTPFMAIAGVLFGLKYGFIYSIFGGVISAIITFGISKKLGKEWVDGILENKHLKLLIKYNSRLERGGFIDLFILRIAPVMPFNVLNILMGVSHIKTRTYVIGTFWGLIPSNLISVYFGTFIAKLF